MKACAAYLEKVAVHSIHYSSKAAVGTLTQAFSPFCRKELEENSEELIRIKECYVQLSEESRGLEQRLKEDFDKEKQIVLSEVRIYPFREKSLNSMIFSTSCSLLLLFGSFVAQ